MESPLKYNAFLTNTNNHFQHQGIIMGASAVFLDRDGVINQESDYVHTIDEFKFIKNVIPAMKMIKDKGYALIIVTNQSGIARGYYTEEDFLKLTEWMDWSLQLEGIRLDGIYYCPHHPDKGFPGERPEEHVGVPTVTAMFNSCWKKTSFAATCNKKPTVHDLRHTFTTVRINKWAEQDISFEEMLPYLCKHLGHKKFDETYYYFHVLEDSYNVIRKKDKTSNDVIPEVKRR